MRTESDQQDRHVDRRLLPSLGGASGEEQTPDRWLRLLHDLDIHGQGTQMRRRPVGQLVDFIRTLCVSWF